MLWSYGRFDLLGSLVRGFRAELYWVYLVSVPNDHAVAPSYMKQIDLHLGKICSNRIWSIQANKQKMRMWVRPGIFGGMSFLSQFVKPWCEMLLLNANMVYHFKTFQMTPHSWHNFVFCIYLFRGGCKGGIHWTRHDFVSGISVY